MRFLTVLIFAGCSAALGDDLRAGSDADADADADSDGDADGGPDADADSDSDLFGKEGPKETDGAFDTSSCADDVDNDADGLEDCAEPSCLRAAVCCSGDSLALSDAFEGADVDLGTWSRFGEPSPQISSGWLSPSGDALFDSGILSRDAFDPGMELVVSAVADVPADCADLCLETVGVGLTDRASLGAATGVDPVAAVVLSADAGRLVLVAGGAWADEISDVPTGSRIGVRLGTDGRVEGLVDGEVRLAADPGTVETTRPLHAVAYGRSPDGAARIDEIQVSTTACSNPAGGIRGDAPVLAPRVGAWDDGSVGKPAAMLDVDGRVVVYYETGTGVGRAISDDGIAFDRQPTEAPVLEGDFGAPSAIPYGGAVWLAVEVPLDGGATHGVEIHASADTAGESFDGVALSLVEPSGDAASFGDPALVDYGGAPVLYLTVADESGVTSIGRISLDPVSAVPGPLEIVLEPSLEGLVAPDGVAAPTVTVERGWHEMWFEERNGLDTRIGYAASGDGRLFEPFDSAVLEPSAGAWDALAVGDPSTVIFGGSVLLYYAGRTGSAESIGLVERVLPWIE